MNEERPDPVQRRRGRPPAEVKHTSVSSWIPADQHDRLARIAVRREIPVSALIRTAIFILLSDTTES